MLSHVLEYDNAFIVPVKCRIGHGYNADSCHTEEAVTIQGSGHLVTDVDVGFSQTEICSDKTQRIDDKALLFRYIQSLYGQH
jgi:hypothetical protein